MFDNIGKDLDEEANKRRAASLTITLLGLGGGVGLFVGITAWTAAQVIQNTDIVQDMVELIEEDIVQDAAPPPPPPPPPPPAAAEASEEEETEDTPDEMVEEVKELKEEVKEEMKSDVKPAGVEGGVEGGVIGGVVGGVQGGIVGGVVGGQLGGGVTVHATELEVKKRFVPEYPEAAKALNLGDQRCLIKVFIDEEGVPYDAIVEQCPKVFEQNAKEGALKFRWYPYKHEGKKTRVQTTIAFNYKMNN